MWKKKILVVLMIVIIFAFNIIVYADHIPRIQATIVNYPIIVDNKQVAEKDVSMVSIQDRIYLPIRAICEILQIEIEWNEEGRVEIITNEAKAENTGVEVGYYGINGWITTKIINPEIAKETAIAIADDVFFQIKGEDFVNKTTIGVRETNDKTCYKIFRYEENVDGGELSIIIRKSDGKILRIVAGE